MPMIVISIVSVLLALMPLVFAAFFLYVTVPKKQLAMMQEIKDLWGISEAATAPAPLMTKQKDVERLMGEYFTFLSLFIPGLLLALLYAAGFVLASAYLNMHYNDVMPRLFPTKFVDASRPVLYAFVGVYVFNLGAMVRRVYLADLSETVFWAALNRFLLSMGVALVFIKTSTWQSAEPYVYFSIGFLANIFLEWILEQTLKLLKMNAKNQPGLPLQTIHGINIWKEFRLEEEGIEDVQNLATADVTALAVRTHYNFRTLIDWVDQAILLCRFSADQIATLSKQATAISAIELAAAAPRANNGDTRISDALADELKVNKVLMAATLDRLYEDQFVTDLWKMWQTGQQT